MENHEDLHQILEDYVDPGRLNYEEWLHVGMALKQSGFPVEVWDSWSRKDAGRYHKGECQEKWESFRGSSLPVDSGTIIHLAEEYGDYSWQAQADTALDTSNFEFNPGAPVADRVIDTTWIQSEEIPAPKKWDPVSELKTYISLLFNVDEYVGIAVKSREIDGDDPAKPTRYVPKDGGFFHMTAGELIDKLQHCGGDIGSVIGDINPKAGAWIRFNPLDGKGIRDENVTDYRYALVECDDMELEKQYALIKALNLPVKVLVYSGKKSLHAIVKIEAGSRDEYRKRVDHLYTVCKKNGLKIDNQNKNPSRLSRMPGAERNGKRQYIIASNIGASSYEEWKDYVESLQDDLPDVENLNAYQIWNLPPLAPELIRGVLRMGHKMLISGPSKAGKSFALIELCIAIAEGGQWMGFQCRQGRVLYVNLELDPSSCIHRFFDAYQALGYWDGLNNRPNIDIWNLRGRSESMDKLAPKLIRRAKASNYAAIIIDPIYKVITGDENSADQMAAFCNMFDKVASELGSAVIYCHHHSKGFQGTKKATDRASGSGVFARDPDAILDMIQLELKDSAIAKVKNAESITLAQHTLEMLPKDPDAPDWKEALKTLGKKEDDLAALNALIKARATPGAEAAYERKVHELQDQIDVMTAWRIDGILREFKSFDPINIFFRYPIHQLDHYQVLENANAEGSKSKSKRGDPRTTEEAKAQEKQDRTFKMYEDLERAAWESGGDKREMCEMLGVKRITLDNRICTYRAQYPDGTLQTNGRGQLEVDPKKFWHFVPPRSKIKPDTEEEG